MKNLIAFFEIPVVDFDRAVRFYESLLNCQLTIMDWETEKMAFFTNNVGECIGSLSYAPDFKPSKDGILLSFSVENMETALSLVKNNGGEIIRAKTKIESDNKGYFSIFIDSEGNKVGLYSEE